MKVAQELLRRANSRITLDIYQRTHSFSSLMDDLAIRVRVTYGLKADTSSPTFQQVPEPSKLQAKAYQLLAAYPVARN